ncbi:hypothetical protein ACA910_012397 [Epithemia clementina (nom. ined.)]
MLQISTSNHSGTGMNVIEEEDPQQLIQYDDSCSALETEADDGALADEHNRPSSNAAAAAAAAADPYQQHYLKQNALRTGVVAVAVVILGAAASGCFLYLGISNARHDQRDRFDRRASDLRQEIESSLRDYELAAAWIHATCSRRSRSSRDDDDDDDDGRRNQQGTTADNNLTRDEFRILYEYMTQQSGNLEFFLAEWVPNISHAERPALEQEAAAYYAHDPHVNYQGFTGLEPNPNETTAEWDVYPRSEQPFYFPIQFLEPYENIGNGTHLDLYSLPKERVAIDQAIQEFRPVLTEKFRLYSQWAAGYSVSLMHPGVPLSPNYYVEPRDLSFILIRMESLLQRAARYQPGGFAVYLFDSTTPLDEESVEGFLGGIDILDVGANDNNSSSSSSSSHGKNTITKQLTFHDENVTMNDVKDRTEWLFYEDTIAFGLRKWTIVVIPIDNAEYAPDVTFPILAGVLIFAASLLLVWIWVINNRNRSKHVHKIINKAAAESAIVSSLYPAAVRDRLIQLVSSGRGNQSIAPAKSRGDTIMGSSGGGCAASNKKQDMFKNDGSEVKRFIDSRSSALEKSVGIAGSEPIAEQYLATTVMFADLAGFTRWSSSKTPTQVFQLLETLYGAFDRLAERRKVFKVETIGDCYVAVAGVPDPQPDHAVIMARFAQDCMTKMHELLAVLVDCFGEDTLELELRIGLHSGPVTGGVLRGQKSRFQLFGDTMNTASRVETTGMKGRIHVSQETADELKARGKGHLLIPRQDRILARGKGELQTYWVQFQSTQSTISGFSVSSCDGVSGSAPDDQLGYLLQLSREGIRGIRRHSDPDVNNITAARASPDSLERGDSSGTFDINFR